MTARASVRIPVVSARTGRPARISPAATVPVTGLAVTDAAPAPTEPLYPAALSAPVDWESISVDVRRWIGLRPLPESPFNFRPLPRPVSDAWIALRRIEYRFFNDRPTATPKVPAQNALTGVITGNLNGADPDGDQISYSLVDGPTSGELVLGPDGSYTYTPDNDFAHAGGTDSFLVTVDDESGNPWHLHGLADLLGLSKPATVAVTLKVNPVDNRAPEVSAAVAGPDPDEDGVVSGRLPVTDSNGDPLSYAVVTEADKGTVAVTDDGTYTYTPDADKRHAAAADDATAADKTDAFTIEVRDGFGGVSLSTVNVILKPANIDPGAAPEVSVFDSPEVLVSDVSNSDGSRFVTVSTTQVLLVKTRASDDDGDLVIVEVTNADNSKGTVVPNADGSFFLYKPTAATIASLSPVTDDVTITLDDGHGGVYTTTKQVTISNIVSIFVTLDPSSGIVVTPVASGSGGTYSDPSGQSVALGSIGIPIEGTSLSIAVDPAGENLVVSSTANLPPGSPPPGPLPPDLKIPITDTSGNDVGWNVVVVKKPADENGYEEPKSVRIYAQSRLAVFLYLLSPPPPPPPPSTA